VINNQGGLSAKLLNRKDEKAISIVDWLSAASTAKDQTCFHHGEARSAPQVCPGTSKVAWVANSNGVQRPPAFPDGTESKAQPGHLRLGRSVANCIPYIGSASQQEFSESCLVVISPEVLLCRRGNFFSIPS
jgi:hypothetical protein